MSRARVQAEHWSAARARRDAVFVATVLMALQLLTLVISLAAWATLVTAEGALDALAAMLNGPPRPACACGSA